MKVAKYILAVITLLLSVYAFIIWHYVVDYWSINFASYL